MTPPIFSVIMPVWHPDPGQLQEAVDSVYNQTTGDWELLAVCDGPQPDEVMQVLASDDPRIITIERSDQGGIVAASAAGLAAATGEFIALLDNDDVLALDVLGACAWELTRWDDVDVMYTDEDKLDLDGNRRRSYLKPGWSPERLRSNMYIGHLGMYRRSLVEQVGGFRPGFDGSQDHDLALRVTEQARRVVHVPRIGYHWRESATSTALDPTSKDWAFDAGVRAVQSHLDRCSIPATAKRRENMPGTISIDPVPGHDFGMVSIVIPTSGGAKFIDGRHVPLIENALTSIRDRSSYQNYEVVAVLDQRGTQEIADRIEAIDPTRVRVVQDTRPFSFSAACNLGAMRSTGSTLLFLNDDTEVLTSDWLERLAMHSQMDSVGAVGARLEYPDGRIQHGGVVLRDGGAAHKYMGVANEEPGYYGELRMVHNTAAVTGACLAVQRALFEAVGGFTLDLPLSFNDIDLCLKLLRRGFRTVFDAETRLMHYESVSRNPEVLHWEADTIRTRWWSILNHDPYDNPLRSKTAASSYSPPDAMLQLRELRMEPFHGRSWPLDRPMFYQDSVGG